MARRTVDDESWERLIEVAAEFGLRHPDAVLVGLGQFKGVETGLRQLRRSAPLEGLGSGTQATAAIGRRTTEIRGFIEAAPFLVGNGRCALCTNRPAREAAKDIPSWITPAYCP